MTLKTKEKELELTILMPCLNEESGVGSSVLEAKKALSDNGISGEVLVVDNGSSDRSVEAAEKAGARVVHETRKGYGSAYLKGFNEAAGKYIIIGDSDGTYDFSMTPKFLELLREGNDFVNGNRMKGGIAPGAMPFLHRYIGNPFLSWLLNRLSGSKLSDAHCGMRGFSREALQKLDLRALGMELASEMIINASRSELRTAEIPIPYRARVGSSKIRTFYDGWRHLRFMLLYSPSQLFFLPGLLAFAAGMGILLILLWGEVQIASITFGIHYMVVGSLLAVLGVQVLTLGILARLHALSIGILRHDPLIRWVHSNITLEWGLAFGSIIALVGLGLLSWILATWLMGGFASQPTGAFLRPALLGLTLVLIGVQTVFSSFFHRLLTMQD